MKFTVPLAAALSLPFLVNAQYGPSPAPATSSTGGTATPQSSATLTSTGTSTTSSTPAAPASNSTNIFVLVAAGGKLVYNPSNFTAANGTTVTFIIPAGSISHSVTQGSFSPTCQYLAASGADPAGFDSGLQSGKQFSIQITNDQQPIWFFCKQDSHCGLGMVGAINAPTTGNTFDAYMAAAKALGTAETSISDSGPVTGGVNGVAKGTPSPTSTTSSSSTTSSTPSSSASHLVANGLFAVLAAVFGITLA
ncbi:hypothetical protein BC827DRAFT_1168716 [Russula dissimulans]|nr:hypothetical protein BC827DRAFT_1168716 [Russula dissimulans]